MRADTPSKAEHLYKIFEDRIRAEVWPVGSVLPTELELAAEFGCGRNTISQAITRLVHDGMVERRKRAGTQVIRNSASRNSTVQLDAFAFIYPSDRHEGIWRTVNGFQDAAHGNHRRVVTLSTGIDYEKEAEYLGRLAEFDVLGAVIYPIIPSPKALVQLSNIIVESSFPIVLVDLELPGLRCPSVVVDNFHAGYTMTRLLIDRGSKRIGFFADHSWASSVSDRYHGFCWAMKEAGLPVEKERVFLEPEMLPNFKDPLEIPTELANRYLDQSSDLDAVVCVNDFLAHGLIKAASQRGLSVPEKLKVVGIDDLTAQSGAIGLTTYRIPFETLGGKAFELLDAALAHNLPQDIEVRVCGHVVERESA